MPIQLHRSFPLQPIEPADPLVTTTLLDWYVQIATQLDPGIQTVRDFLTTPRFPPTLTYWRPERNVILWDKPLLENDPDVIPYVNPWLGVQTITLANGDAASFYAFLGTTAYDTLPLYMIAYPGRDGLLHFYTPANGNAVNTLTGTTFMGSADDLVAAQHVGYASLDALANDMHHAHVAARIYDYDMLCDDIRRELAP